jgi:hypothetical protein
MPPATLKWPGDQRVGRIVRHPRRARLLAFVRRGAVELADRLTVLRVVERGGGDPGDVRAVRWLLLALDGRRPRRT